jgi:hypothetical protein
MADFTWESIDSSDAPTRPIKAAAPCALKSPRTQIVELGLRAATPRYRLVMQYRDGYRVTELQPATFALCCLAIRHSPDDNSGLALTSLEARAGLIDHVNAAPAAHDTVVAVTPAKRFQ